MNIVAYRDAGSETLVPRHNLHIQQRKGKSLEEFGTSTLLSLVGLGWYNLSIKKTGVNVF